MASDHWVWSCLLLLCFLSVLVVQMHQTDSESFFTFSACECKGVANSAHAHNSSTDSPHCTGAHPMVLSWANWVAIVTACEKRDLVPLEGLVVSAEFVAARLLQEHQSREASSHFYTVPVPNVRQCQEISEQVECHIQWLFVECGISGDECSSHRGHYH